MLTLLILPVLLTVAAAHNFGIRVSPTRLAELSVPLAVPRQVGTPGHSRVRDHLIEFLSRQPGWQVELDTFYSATPIGRERFDNIIATLQLGGRATSKESQPRRLVLAAHYDSKRLPRFVGATDSAVPCAVLLSAAEAIGRAALNEGRQRLVGNSDTEILQLVFFDGEEAFDQWTRTDSLYGSRHLARRWAEEGKLRTIDAFVLLDLIGGSDPKFYFSPHASSDTSVVSKELYMFAELAATEAAVLNDNNDSGYFQLAELSSGAVQDDQTPFQEAGVPTVHVIPQPFPAVWHTPADTFEAVQWRQAADVATIVLSWAANRIGLF